jgi:hypothetical protein
VLVDLLMVVEFLDPNEAVTAGFVPDNEARFLKFLDGGFSLSSSSPNDLRAAGVVRAFLNTRGSASSSNATSLVALPRESMAAGGWDLRFSVASLAAILE